MRRMPLPRGFRRLAIFSSFLLFSLGGYAQSATNNPPTPQNDVTQASQAGPVAFPARQIKEQLIGEISPGAEMDRARSTGNHIAWVEKAEGRRTVWLDGKQVGDTYKEVKYLRFSPGEKHLAFAAKRESRWVLVVDGVAKSGEYSKLTALEFSSSGESFAVGACLGKKCRIVVNGKETGPEFENISVPAFTPDGEHLVYFGKRHKKWVQVFDGKELGPEMDDLSYWFFPPNHEGAAVAARMGKDWTWIVHGVPGPTFDVLGDIVFTRDGKHYAYGGTNEKRSRWGLKKHKTIGAIVIDGKVAGTFEGKGFGGFFKSNERIMRGPRHLFPDFHGVSDPQYTPDGKLVYAGRMSEGNVIVYVDGMPGPSFDDIVSPIAISPDGKLIVYLARQGDSLVEVRNQKAGPSFPGSFAPLLAISRDGSHLAYEIVRGGAWFGEGLTDRAVRQMVIDGKAAQKYDAKGMGHFAFSADGKHHFYEVYGASGDRDRVIFDGMESKLYDSVFRSSTRFVDETTIAGETTIEFVARDGRRFLRVRETLAGDAAKAR